MTSPARLRAGLTVALSAVLVAAAVPAVQAAGAPASEGASFKTRAANAVLAAVKDRPSRLAADLPTVSGKARKVAAAERELDLRLPAENDAARAAEPALVAAPTCEGLGLDLTSTNDQVWVHWNASDATSYSVYRQRFGGAWKRLAVVAAGQTSVLDRGVNPRGVYTYRLDADGISCPLGAWWTMATDDGWGEVDALYGGAGDGNALMAQDTWTLAMPTGGSGFQPAFSPDGRRLVAATQNDEGRWLLHFTDPSLRSSEAHSFTVPEGFIGLEPSWSPDGRTVAYTRYAIDAEGTVSAPQLRLVDSRNGTERAVTGGTGLIQPDWRSGTSLVAAGAVEGQGLYTLPVSGGTTPTAVDGTTNAGAPEVGPDGRIWYVEGDGDTFSIRVRGTDGSTTIWQSSTTAWFEQPRTAPDGQVFYVKVEGNDPADPDDNTFSVVNAGTNEDTAIGAPRDTSLGGFLGYDVRQPKSKGTSDYVGDAAGDLLARDSAGALWAFPSSPSEFVEPRVKVGTGWNIYVSFVAAGDLNGDNRADLIAKDKDGKLWFYAGRGNAKFAGRVLAGTGWNGLSYLAPGDVDGDGRADLAAVTSGGTLYLYSGTGTGTSFTKRLLGSGFAGMSGIIGPGDFNYDGTADLLSREKATGKLYLSAGLGGGAFAAKKVVGSGWNGFTGFGTPELDGGFNGLYTRLSNGTMRYYASVGDGGFSNDEVYAVPGSWNSYTFTS